MDWRGKALIATTIVLVAISVVLSLLGNRIRVLTEERNRYKGNTEQLLGDVQFYKVRDSLNAARVQSLDLTLKEYERFRAEDAAEIEQLKRRNRDLTAVNKTQSQTILQLQAIPRDTVIIRDSIPIPAVAVHCGDAWYDFDGLLTAREFTGTLSNRDSLVLAETVQYRRFLGFLWKTSRVKDRRLDVLSKNPHTQIMGIEFVHIEK